MSDQKAIPNHAFYLNTHVGQSQQNGFMQSFVPSSEGFEIDPRILMMKMNQIKDAKQLLNSQLLDNQNNHSQSAQDNLWQQKDRKESNGLNSVSSQFNGSMKFFQYKNPQIQKSVQSLENQEPVQAKQSQQLGSLVQNDASLFDEHKNPEPIITKKQIQEQTQHLNELKQKKKEVQKKKIVQKMNQQQKQRLEKLRQQTRQYQEMKKQKDKQIMQFQKKLHTLKKDKEKQIFQQKKRQEMREIQQRKKRQQKYYQAMMLQKQRLQQQMIRRRQEELRRKRQKQQQKRREQERLAKINSTSYHKAIRQRQQKQYEEKIKIEQIKQFLLKRNIYHENLRNLELKIMKQARKPIKQKSQMQLKQQERRLSTKSLSAAQIYRMGQEFMEEAHLSIDQQHIQQSKLFLSEVYNSLRQSTRTEYKDYLREQKIKRERFFKSTGKVHANPQIRELKKLIVKEENSPQKLLKAKLLTERLDSKVVKKSSVKLKADSIAAKLKVIQEFT